MLGFVLISIPGVNFVSIQLYENKFKNDMFLSKMIFYAAEIALYDFAVKMIIKESHSTPCEY